MAPVGHYINGFHAAPPEPESGQRYGVVFNPATGEAQHQLAFASAARVAEAIAAAAAALPGWRATSLTKRADVFFKVRHLLVQRRDEWPPW